MFSCYYTFRSLTAAQQAAMLLRRFGIAASVVRTPEFAATKGCGYAVKVADADEASTGFIFHREGVSYMRAIHIRQDERESGSAS